MEIFQSDQYNLISKNNYPELQTIGMTERSFCQASDSLHLPGFCTFTVDTQN